MSSGHVGIMAQHPGGMHPGWLMVFKGFLPSLSSYSCWDFFCSVSGDGRAYTHSFYKSHRNTEYHAFFFFSWTHIQMRCWKKQYLRDDTVSFLLTQVTVTESIYHVRPPSLPETRSCTRWICHQPPKELLYILQSMAPPITSSCKSSVLRSTPWELQCLSWLCSTGVMWLLILLIGLEQSLSGGRACALLHNTSNLQCNSFVWWADKISECLCAGLCHHLHQGAAYQCQGTQPREGQVRFDYSEKWDLLKIPLDTTRVFFFLKESSHTVIGEK